MIHSTAIIDPAAKIADDAVIGPYSIIGPYVEIGPKCKIGPHVVIDGPTRMGSNNQFFQFASIGGDPQDKKFQGGDTVLEIGDNNVFRECTTVNRGTEEGGSVTKIGSDNLFMAYSHIAHDCRIGDHCVMSNSTALAGHVEIENYVTLSGYAAVHQFCKIGSHSFIGRATYIVKDILPFLLINGHDAKVYGLNSIGLTRRGFSPETLLNLKRAYKIIFRKNLSVEEAIAELKTLTAECPEVQAFIDGLNNSERSILR